VGVRMVMHLGWWGGSVVCAIILMLVITKTITAQISTPVARVVRIWCIPTTRHILLQKSYECPRAGIYQR